VLRRRVWVVFAAVLAVAVAVVVHKYPRICWLISHYQADPLPLRTTFVTIPVNQPSGIVYHARRKTLIVVSDKGHLVEMDDRFNVLQRLDVAGDLEGLSVHPDTGTLFIASESSNTVMEYDLDTHRRIRTLYIDFSSDPELAAGLKWNKGLEGVTIVTTASGEHHLFVSVEAHPARVLRLSADLSANATAKAREYGNNGSTGGLRETVQIREVYDYGLTRISDIEFDVNSGLLLIVSSGERVLTLAEPNGRALRSFRLPGKKPEGICVMPGGEALVVDDTGGAWIIRGARGFLQSMAGERLRPATGG